MSGWLWFFVISSAVGLSVRSVIKIFYYNSALLRIEDILNKKIRGEACSSDENNYLAEAVIAYQRECDRRE